MALFNKNQESSNLPVPEHIAIIMDGNGRWATRRLLPRTAGHAAGAEAFRRIALYCRKVGVKYLTVYAFFHGELEAASRGGQQDHVPDEGVSS